jgi:hypothetical protein
MAGPRPLGYLQNVKLFKISEGSVEHIVQKLRVKSFAKNREDFQNLENPN